MIAELIGARMVVFKEEFSKRWEMGAKSRVKPAKMLMLRSLPITSETSTVLSSAGAEVEGEVVLSGIAGYRVGGVRGCCLLRAYAQEVRDIVRRG
jgi:hypothetical protein